MDFYYALDEARKRLTGKGIATTSPGSFSLRLPGVQTMLLLTASDDIAQRIDLNSEMNSVAALHAKIYRLRNDVGAIVAGSGRFGHALINVGGVISQVFDEQARHLGTMHPPVSMNEPKGFANALKDGANAVLVDAIPVCMGMTCQHVIFNAELFEKCAKAYVLAVSTGKTVTTLPWWVSQIANGRLRKDELRAAMKYAEGETPDETRGY